MADRGLCAVCGGDYTVAQDGTPYKHSSTEGDPCPGADQPISVKAADAVWLVYGGEDGDGDYRVQVTGPVSDSDDHPETFEFIDRLGPDDEERPNTLPLLGTATGPTLSEINAVLPEGSRLVAPGTDAPVNDAPADDQPVVQDDPPPAPLPDPENGPEDPQPASDPEVTPENFVPPTEDEDAPTEE